MQADLHAHPHVPPTFMPLTAELREVLREALPNMPTGERVADPSHLLSLAVASDFALFHRLLAEGPDKLPKALSGLPLLIDVAKNRHLLGASL